MKTEKITSAEADFQKVHPEIRDAIDRFLHKDPGLPATVVAGYRRMLRLMCAIVTAANLPLDAPAALVSDKAINAIHDHYGPPNDPSPQRLNVLYRLADFAAFIGEREAKVDIDGIISNLRERGKRRFLEMPDHLVELVARFDAPEAFDHLVDGLFTVIVQALSSDRGRHYCIRAQDAIAALIVLTTCSPKEFLSELEFCGQKRRGGSGRRPELSNACGSFSEADLPDILLELIDLLFAAQKRDHGRVPRWLFESIEGLQRTPDTIAAGISSVLERVVSKSSLLQDIVQDITRPALRPSSLKGEPHLQEASGRVSEDTEKLPMKLTFSCLTPIAVYQLKLRSPELHDRQLASLAGYTTTAAFQRYYRPLLGVRASVDFARGLGFENQARRYEQTF